MNCAAQFIQGQSSLFYLDPIPKTRYWNAVCSRTMPVENAADDLLFLRGLPDSAIKTRVSGIVDLYEERINTQARRLGPVANVRVAVVGAGHTVEATTNNDGVFETYGLKPGKYRIDVKLPPDLKVWGSFVELSGRAEREQTEFILTEGRDGRFSLYGY